MNLLETKRKVEGEQRDVAPLPFGVYVTNEGVPRWSFAGLGVYWIWLAFAVTPDIWMARWRLTPFGGDTLASNLPIKSLAFEQLADGRWPLWTSRLGCGTPLAADSISLPLDPRNLWWLVAPPWLAYWLSLTTATVLGGWILLAYLTRRHQLGPLAAWVATAVYFFGAVTFDECRLHSTGVTLAGFPAVVWLAERLADRPNFRRCSALAVGWSALFFLGTVAYLVFFPPLVFGWTLFYARKIGQPASGRFVALFALAGVLALGLSAVTLAPMLEFITLANRGGEYQADPFLARSLLFAVVGPTPAGGWIPDHNTFLYVGLAALPMLVGGGANLPRVAVARSFGIVALTVFALLTSPLKPWLCEWIPALATFSFYRLAFAVGFSAAVLVGHFVQRLKTARAEELTIVKRLAAILAGVQVCVGLTCLLVLIAPRLPSLASIQSVLSGIAPTLALPSVLMLVGVRCLACASFWLDRRNGAARLTPALFLLAELLLAGVIMRPGKPMRTALFPPTPEAQFLAAQSTPDYRAFQVLAAPGREEPVRDSQGRATLYLDAGLMHGLSLASVYHSLIPASFATIIDAFGDRALRQQAYPRATNAVMTTSQAESGLFDLLAVRFLFAPARINAPGINLCLDGKYYSVYERPRALPRAYFTRHVTWLAPGELTDWLAEVHRNGVTNVALEGSANKAWAPPTGPFRFTPAQFREDAGDRVEFDVEADGVGAIVLADTFFPGWRAWVDGQEMTIVKANGFTRALCVGPGRHRIEFRYQPDSFRRGFWISLLTLAGIAFLSFGHAGRQLVRSRLFSKEG